MRGPDRTFGSNATIDLGDRVVTMTYAGRGHTDGDVAVLVPDTDAMFLGDLVEESAHPSFGDDCWPLEWADTLTSHLVQADGAHRRRARARPPGRQAFVSPPARRDRRRRGRDPRAPARRGSLEEALRDPDPRLPYPLDHLDSAIRRGWDHLTPPTP